MSIKCNIKCKLKFPHGKKVLSFSGKIPVTRVNLVILVIQITTIIQMITNLSVRMVLTAIEAIHNTGVPTNIQHLDQLENQQQVSRQFITYLLGVVHIANTVETGDIVRVEEGMAMVQLCRWGFSTFDFDHVTFNHLVWLGISIVYGNVIYVGSCCKIVTFITYMIKLKLIHTIAW